LALRIGTTGPKKETRLLHATHSRVERVLKIPKKILSSNIIATGSFSGVLGGGRKTCGATLARIAETEMAWNFGQA